MERTRLCGTDEILDNTLYRFVVDGREMVIARIGMDLYALEERCTHRGGPLSEGTLEEGVVTCPWHFGQFDVKTGQAVGPPASEPLSRYSVEVENGVLYLSLARPALS